MRDQLNSEPSPSPAAGGRASGEEPPRDRGSVRVRPASQHGAARADRKGLGSHIRRAVPLWGGFAVPSLADALRSSGDGSRREGPWAIISLTRVVNPNHDFDVGGRSTITYQFIRSRLRARFRRAIGVAPFASAHSPPPCVQSDGTYYCFASP